MALRPARRRLEPARHRGAAGLIDDLTITTVPVLIGNGRPLFGPDADGEPCADRCLTLVASRAYPFGFVQSTYRVAEMT